MTKTIWTISKYASPLKYGFASRPFYLAAEFSALGYRSVMIGSDSNHLCQFPMFEQPYTKEDNEGVETWWVRTRRYEGAKSLGRVLSWLDFEYRLWRMPKEQLPAPDVVIISSLSLLTIFNGCLLRRRYGCRLVLEIRDIWPLTIVEEGGFSRWNPGVMFLSMVESFAYRTADVVVGTMPNLREHVIGKIGPTEKCVCVPFGYDPLLYANLEALPDDYAETWIPKDKFVVGYAGTIGRTNAMDTLIECAELMKDEAGIHFLVVGDGDLRESYIARTADLPNITFAPRVRKAQVQAVLAHCQLVYFSVENSEVWRYGLSLNKLIDYMYSGKPVIASYSGFPSMVNEAQCGEFVPADDVVTLRETFLRYSRLPAAELAAIGKRGRDWLLEHRPYGKVVRNHIDVFLG